MKRFLWIIVILGLVLLVLVSGIYLVFKSSVPVYKGSIEIPGLSDTVHVHFDDYGIPHISAKNDQDLYKVFGYIHASERLFQMEILRRIGHGNLAEILGRKT
jgi:penicillin amidase